MNVSYNIKDILPTGCSRLSVWYVTCRERSDDNRQLLSGQMLTVIHQYRSDVDKGQLLIKTLIKEHLCLNSRNAMKKNCKPLLTCG